MLYFNIILSILLFNFNILLNNSEKKANISWNKLDEGLYFANIDAPQKSIVGNSKISVLKIDPKYYNFCLLSASEHNNKTQTIKDWAIQYNLTAAINAGMFKLSNNITSTGYMKNYSHINNSKFKRGFNSLAAFNRIGNNVPEFQIIDLTDKNHKEIINSYNSFFQGIRLIDNNQKPIFWHSKPKMKCSICALATDKNNNVLFIFSRSPYTINNFIKMLLTLQINIYNAMYLEGGPETSFYVSSKDTVIENFGSYVSPSYANDKNDHFWKLPNVIGIKKK